MTKGWWSLSAGIFNFLAGLASILSFLGIKPLMPEPCLSAPGRPLMLFAGVGVLVSGAFLFKNGLKQIRDLRAKNGPQLKLSLKGSAHALRLRIDENVFYYSIVVQNVQTRYDAKAYDLTASLSFKHSKGRKIEIPTVQFLKRLNGMDETLTRDVSLGMNEIAELVILVSKGKFLTLREWPLNESAETEIGLGEWTCNLIVKGVNATAKARLKLLRQPNNPVQFFLAE